MDTTTLMEWVRDARRRTLDLVSDLDEAQLHESVLPGQSPLRWLLGHVAWYQERWVLRHSAGLPPRNASADALYDPALTRPAQRGTLSYYSRDNTFHYLEEVRDTVLERLRYGKPTPSDCHFAALSVAHEDRHVESILALRQSAGFAAPQLLDAGLPAFAAAAGPHPGDVELPGGTIRMGAVPDGTEVWHDEKWSHPVQVAPFALSRAPVTQGEFALFVGDRGYDRPELWSTLGWRWREAEGRDHPRYWRWVAGVGWQRRVFDRWVVLEAYRPMVHLNWYEADAYCRWAGRRLPLEAEWEFAAGADTSVAPGREGIPMRRLPWGNEPAGFRLACLDSPAAGLPDVAALENGDSPSGCRQMLGSVWEWTASHYSPYPGFEAPSGGSAGQFQGRMALRGGSWATRSRQARNTMRLGLGPERDDYWSGFRTCAL